MNKKNVLTSSEEELLDLLESEDIVDGSEEFIDDNIMAFIRKFELKPGNEPVKASLLFKIYRQTTIENLSVKKFIGYLTNIFQSVIKEDGLYYLVNRDALLLSENLAKVLENKDSSLKRIIKLLDIVREFTIKYELKKGTNGIPAVLIHRLFVSFRKECGLVENFSEQLVIKSLKKFFNMYITDRIYYYGISDDIFQYITPEEIKKTKDMLYAIESKKRKKEEKQEKRKQIQSLKSRAKSKNKI